MYWKNKWDSIGVKKKIFLTNTVIISLSFIVLYIIIYVFMPRVYQAYKMNKINNSINQVRSELSENSDLNLNEVLDNFCYKNNVNLFVFNEDIQTGVQTIIYTYDRKANENFKEFQINDKKNEFKIQPNRDKIGKEKINISQIIANKNNDNIIKSVYIKSIDLNCVMLVHAQVKPMDEATTIVSLFFPFAILVSIVIAIAISTYYSRIISKPLIKINEAAKKMAKLDFGNYLEVDGQDEIAELSTSLNYMSKNLKETLEELERVNLKLQKDIEVERNIEKERREFIGVISHELKSPITIISGQLEGMIYGIGKYKDRDKYLRESFYVTQNMRELVQELLQLTEQENRLMNCNKENVNLTRLITEIVTELIYFIEEKKLKLSLNLSEDMFILGDLGLLKKAFTNIIKNAITYSPEGENIIIEGDNNILKVINTGVTIEEKEIEKLFKAFYRVDKSRNRKTGGTGLGLYIVKSIFDKHGNIKYYIKSNENSVEFTIEF